MLLPSGLQCVRSKLYVGEAFDALSGAGVVDIVESLADDGGNSVELAISPLG